MLPAKKATINNSELLIASDTSLTRHQTGQQRVLSIETMATFRCSTYFHWKLLVGGVILILLDSLMNFRLEYLYPVLMFMRSVYDSYKYQGFVSGL